MIGDDLLGDACERVWIGDIERIGMHVRTVADRLLKRLEPTPSDDDRGTVRLERAAKLAADPRTAAGDQDRAALDVHRIASFYFTISKGPEPREAMRFRLAG